MRKSLIKFMFCVMCSLAVFGVFAVCSAKEIDISENEVIHVSNEVELRSAIWKGTFKPKKVTIVLDSDITVGFSLGYVGSKVKLYKNGHSLKEFYTIDSSMYVENDEKDSEYTEIGFREIDL